MPVGRHLALSRVARLPVGDLARLAAVAPRVAAAADGEGGLVLVALDAANVTRPTLSPSKLGAPRFVRQSSPRSSLALHATVKNGAARVAMRLSAGICRLTARRTAFEPFCLPFAVVCLARFCICGRPNWGRDLGMTYDQSACLQSLGTPQ